jgi:hypothetical protein
MQALGLSGLARHQSSAIWQEFRLANGNRRARDGVIPSD